MVQQRYNSNQRETFSGLATMRNVGALVGGLLLLLLVALNNPVAVVDEGHVGLITELGRAIDLRGPGVTLINPFIQDLKEVETRVRPIDFTEIDAASKEAQSVKLTGKLNFALQEADIISLYREVGLDFQGRILNAALNSTAKAVLPQYSVDEILPNRRAIEDKIVEDLNVRLRAYGIKVTAIFLENVSFSAEYQAAIEAKQTAAQNALKEVEITNQAREKAKQAVETAKGQGDSALELARRQAEANRLLSESLSSEVLRNKELDKWDGKLPQVQTGSSGSSIMVTAPAPR